MKTITLALTIFFSLIATNPSFSQPDEMSPETCQKIKAEKVAFISSQIELTVEEAQQFWPLYNELEKKIDELHLQRREMMLRMKTGSKLQDSDLEQISDKFIELEIAEAKLHETFHKQFKKTLPIRKVLKFYQAERKFKKQLLKKIGKRHKGGRFEEEGR